MIEEMTAPHAMIAAALCAKRVQFGGLERALVSVSVTLRLPCGLRCHLCGGEHLVSTLRCAGRIGVEEEASPIMRVTCTLLTTKLLTSLNRR